MRLSPAARFARFVFLGGLLLAALVVGGCNSMFHTGATIGPDLQPHATAGISIPFGK